MSRLRFELRTFCAYEHVTRVMLDRCDNQLRHRPNMYVIDSSPCMNDVKVLGLLSKSMQSDRIRSPLSIPVVGGYEGKHHHSSGRETELSQ